MTSQLEVQGSWARARLEIIRRQQARLSRVEAQLPGNVDDEDLEWMARLSEEPREELFRTATNGKALKKQVSEYFDWPRRAEDDLHMFVREAWPHAGENTTFVDNWHLRIVSSKLQLLTEGVGKSADDGYLKNLAIGIPPGCGKSFNASVAWPVWSWIKNPGIRFAGVSYVEEVATGFAERSKQLIESDWFQNRFGGRFRLAGRSKLTHYGTDQGGWRKSYGMGGAITSQHPDILAIDDPLKAQDADSNTDTAQQAVRDWYSGTSSSRGVARDVAIAILMQRLAPRDLIAYVLELGEKFPDLAFEYLCYPMLYDPDHPHLREDDPRTEPGELLFPKLFTESKVRNMTNKMNAEGPHRSAGQLQQLPRNKSGGIFKEPWFVAAKTPLSQMPINEIYQATCVRYWDLAATQGAGDWTAGALMAILDDTVYLLDIKRGRWGLDIRNEIIKSTVERDNQRFSSYRTVFEIEGGSAGKAQVREFAKMLLFADVRGDHPTGPKEVRAQAFVGHVSTGSVRILEAGWNQDLFDEYVGFPGGQHDDQIDACSGAFKIIREIRKIGIS